MPATVLPQQVLLGINFYGYSFARPGQGSSGRVLQEAITADKYLAALKRHRPKLSWKVDEAEHVAKYKACRLLLHTLLPPHPAATHQRMHANNQLSAAQCSSSNGSSNGSSNSSSSSSSNSNSSSNKSNSSNKSSSGGNSNNSSSASTSYTTTPPSCDAAQAGGTRHAVFFPTPASVAARVALATELGVGLSIWELGQGLGSFMDLL
jgi:hypothetical protein